MKTVMKNDLYQHITDQITGMLDAGIVPWRSPILGKDSAGQPKNIASNTPYRGVNVFLLAYTAWSRGYGTPYWLTFNQARLMGGTVKKGEKSSIVVFWKQYEVEDKTTDEPKMIPVLRHYNVFNCEQCVGITAPLEASPEPMAFKPIEMAEVIAKGYQDSPLIEHSGEQAYYRPDTDKVRMPHPERFITSEEYYATLFHELAHSTGHAKRIDRKLDTKSKPFGSPDYSREELVAEMAAAFLSADAGIHPVVIQNQAAYLQGWLKALNNDKRLVVTAAGAGQKAADWILGKRS